MMELMFRFISMISLEASIPFSSFCSVESESVKMTIPVLVCVSVSKVLLICVRVLWMASFSASLFEQKDPQALASSVFSPSGYWMSTPSPAFVVALNAEPSV